MKQKNDIQLRAILERYLIRWRWFVLATTISLLFAYLYLQFTAPIYRTVSSIIVEDEKNSGSSKEDEIFSKIGLLSGIGTRSIENELGLLRSKRLLTEAIAGLGLHIRYFDERGFGKKELYTKSPYLVELINVDDNLLQNLCEREENLFEIIMLANDNFRVIDTGNDEEYITKQGNLLKLEFGDLLIRKNKDYLFAKRTEVFPEVTVQINTVSSVVYDYWSKIKVELIDDNATLIKLSVDDPLKQKAQDILNQVVLEYNREAIEDKNLVAENTSFFIDERLRIINSELDSVESGKEAFKESNNLTNIDVGSSLIMQNASEYSIKEQEVNSQLALLKSMLKYLDSKTDDMLPSNIGISDNGIEQLITEYNGLIIERDKLRVGSGPNNPKVVNLTGQIKQLKDNLKESFKRVRSNLRISRNNLSRQAGIISSQISDVPAQERQFRDIERQQNIKEALYLLLLEKREENSLALAAAAPKAKVVDPAFTYDDPVSPNSGIVFFGALLAGLLFPIFYINFERLLNNRIWSVDDIKSKLKNIPIIGEVPHLDGSQAVIKQNDRTVLSESFRIISANLQYSNSFNRKKNGKGLCIFVTSTVKGEGKTLTSINLATTLALAGNKVLIIGADLRNPQLHHYALRERPDTGLSNYLENKHQQQLNYFFTDSKLHENLKLLLAGKVPPNPAELLQKGKLSEMFSELKQSFDFLIVDTAPAMLIADTFLISGYADLSLYIVRAGHTKKQLLDFIGDAIVDEKIVNPALVLNDVKLANTAYGYGYGYDNSNKERDIVAKAKILFASIFSSVESKVNDWIALLRK